MIRLSTALQTALLMDQGMAQMMAFGVIDIYTGDPPPTPDIPAQGTHIARITDRGHTFVAGQQTGGLRYTLPAAGELHDDGNWVLSGITAGIAGHWRWRANAYDPDSLSQVYPRVDGVAGDSLILTDYNTAAGASTAIDAFILRFEG